MNWPDFFDNTLNRLYTWKGIVSVVALSLIIGIGFMIYDDLRTPVQSSCAACEKERDDYKGALLQVSKMLAMPVKQTSFLEFEPVFMYAIQHDTVPKKPAPAPRGRTAEEKTKEAKRYVDSILNKYKKDTLTMPEPKKGKGNKI